MTRKFFVNVIYQRRQCGRFSRASRTGDQDQPSAQMPKFAGYRRNTKFFERSDLCRDQTEDSSVPIGLLQVVAAKSRFLIHLVSEIEITTLVEKLPFLGACDLAQHQDRLIAKHWFLTHWHHIAVSTHFRRLTLSNMQIRRSFRDDDLQKLIEICHQRRLRCCRTISFCSARASASSAVIRSRLNNSINASSISCIPCLRLV